MVYQYLRSNIFHRFPLKTPELLNSWVSNMKRKGFNPTAASRICSDHFLPEEVILPAVGFKKAALIKNAIPTIFSGFPEHLKKKTKTRSNPMERIRVSDYNL